MNKAIIVFSGHNPRAVISFLRTIDNLKVPYGIIASSDEDTIHLTDYSKSVLAVRSSMPLDIHDITDSIKKLQTSIQAQEYVIAPSTEALNRFLLHNRRKLEKLNCVIPLIDMEGYERISDKKSFAELCAGNGLKIPEEHKSLSQATIPFVAKPFKYYSSSGQTHAPVLVMDENQKNDFMNSYNTSDFYFQEFITGKSYYLLYYFYKDGDLKKLSQINYLQQPHGKSILAAKTSDFHESEESAKYEQLFKSVGYRGLIMIEVMKNKDGTYMIEANPRFWGPSQLFIDAGMNLFEDFLYDWELITERPKTDTRIKASRYYWYGGYIESLKNDGQVIYQSGYTPEEFKVEKDEWMAADVYNRRDTVKLFESEVGQSDVSQR
jgi:predicted ATP-grasp superfamily ATP-dependent carboligase